MPAASRAERIFLLQFRNACGRFGTAFLREGPRRKVSQAHIRLQSLICAPKGCARAFLGFFGAIRCISGAIHAEMHHFCRRSWYNYKHRAVLCLICHSHNSYRAENRPVTANRAVFCFCGCVWCAGAFQRICGAIRAQNRPKRAKRGTLGTTKNARLGRALKKERILCKNGSSAWFWR